MFQYNSLLCEGGCQSQVQQGREEKVKIKELKHWAHPQTGVLRPPQGWKWALPLHPFYSTLKICPEIHVGNVFVFFEWLTQVLQTIGELMPKYVTHADKELIFSLWYLNSSNTSSYAEANIPHNFIVATSDKTGLTLPRMFFMANNKTKQKTFLCILLSMK